MGHIQERQQKEIDRIMNGIEHKVRDPNGSKKPPKPRKSAEVNVDDVDVNEENEENFESKNQLNQQDDHCQENPQRDSDMDSEE